MKNFLKLPGPVRSQGKEDKNPRGGEPCLRFVTTAKGSVVEQYVQTGDVDLVRCNLDSIPVLKVIKIPEDIDWLIATFIITSLKDKIVCLIKMVACGFFQL